MDRNVKCVNYNCDKATTCYTYIMSMAKRVVKEEPDTCQYYVKMDFKEYRFDLTMDEQ